MAGNPNAQRLAELAALVDAVKERVRTQYPETTANGPSGAVCVGLPDLTPLARARDAAAGKMAAIGTVNPRQGGVVNSLVQTIKRAIARGLNWFVRDQVIFNRQMITCIEVCIETLNDINRTIHVLAGQTNTEVQRVRTEAEPLRREAEILRTKTSEFQDLVSHWNRWREEWQLKLHQNEVEFLKSVADLTSTFHQKVLYAESACGRAEARFEQHGAALDERYRQIATELEAACQETAAHTAKEFGATVTRLEDGFRQSVTQLEKSFRETLIETEASFERTTAELEAQFERRATQGEFAFRELEKTNSEAIQGSVSAQLIAMDQRMVKEAEDFQSLLASSVTKLQNQFYGDLDRIRTEYERVIHAELRVVRQRLATGAAAVAPAQTTDDDAGVLPFDYPRFADRFRGSEQYVTESQRFYVPYFTGRRHVLDLGCGRGEFLKLMRDAGVPARGIEASEESAAHCRSLGFEAEKADLFSHLAALAEGSLDGIFCSQVVEHLSPDRLPEMIRLCGTRLATGGVLAIETPNPECLAIFGTHFYLDPTHTRPVPSQLLAFYMEECGVGRIEVHPKSPAAESMPEVKELPEGFREKFFGGLDYAIIGYRL